jgi:hypothetical protein
MTWTSRELGVLRQLRTPGRIQRFLDDLTYRAGDEAACPRTVLRQRRAHCLDGALLAAAALRRLGHPPLLLDLRAIRDDDHVVAVFRQGGRFGALAKSNFTGLRYREPIHRTLRELALTYFEPYFNLAGERTLRSYSALLPLTRLDALRWEFHDEAVEEIAVRLDALRHFPLVSSVQARRLARVDRRSFRAGTLGLRAAGARKVGARPAGGA